MIVYLFLSNFPLKTFPKEKIKVLYIFIPIFIAFTYLIKYHCDYLNVRANGGGFWQLQRNWEDMQRYAQKNTSKNSLFMVPHNMEMGGFRIFSERKLLMCYRDCGIIGFDYKAALEWQKRLADIDAFRVFITKPIGSALINALTKYKVDYIVFMRYAAPPDNEVIKRIYGNDVFVLYQVKR